MYDQELVQGVVTIWSCVKLCLLMETLKKKAFNETDGFKNEEFAKDLGRIKFFLELVASRDSYACLAAIIFFLKYKFYTFLHLYTYIFTTISYSQIL